MSQCRPALSRSQNRRRPDRDQTLLNQSRSDSAQLHADFRIPRSPSPGGGEVQLALSVILEDAVHRVQRSPGHRNFLPALNPQRDRGVDRGRDREVILAIQDVCSILRLAAEDHTGASTQPEQTAENCMSP